jgi:hypothetical protein
MVIYSHDLNLDEVLVIGTEIEYELGIPIDVVPLHELNPVLRLKIHRKGLVVIEKPGMYEYMFM